MSRYNVAKRSFIQNLHTGFTSVMVNHEKSRTETENFPKRKHYERVKTFLINGINSLSLPVVNHMKTKIIYFRQHVSQPRNFNDIFLCK